MTRFKLKPSLRFVPDGTRYIVIDSDTQSKFRVGEMEYRILKHFEETNNVEEVGYVFCAQNGLSIESGVLYGFIQQAISLDLLREESDSVLGRMRSIRPFLFRVRLFDPNRLIDSLVQKCGFLFNVYGASALAALLITSTVILAANFTGLWALRSLQLSSSYLVVMAVVFLLSIGHEMAHGLAAKKVGFEVTEIGFHLHYGLPSFYCKIFRNRPADLKSTLIVLLSGSLFDLILISLFVLTWLALPVESVTRGWIAITVSLLLVKVWLIQLNPLWPYSDGFHITTLLVSRARGKSGE